MKTNITMYIMASCSRTIFLSQILYSIGENKKRLVDGKYRPTDELAIYGKARDVPHQKCIRLGRNAVER
jgi:hypothetical protein